MAAVVASTVVNIVRDIVSDPVYDANGNAMPANDGGIFKAQTLYRYLNDGVKALAEQVGWIVKDWTAFTVVANQANYSLNGQWHQLDLGYHNSFQLMLAPQNLTVWPKAVVNGQAAYFTPHKQTDHMEVGLFPVPNVADPTMTLTPNINSTVTTGFAVNNTATMLPVGYVQIDSEIIAYNLLPAPPAATTATAVTVLVRGQAGTTAASHTAGTTVTHLGAWFYGSRMPNEVTTATDTIELPAGFMYAVQEYVLAKCSYQQEDQQSGKLHMDEFRKECARIYADPNWRSDAQGTQVRPYGGTYSGLAWGNVYVP